MWSPMNEENILSLLFFPEMNVCIYRMSPLQRKKRNVALHIKLFFISVKLNKRKENIH